MAEKEKYYIFSLTRGIKKKKRTHKNREQNGSYQKLGDRGLEGMLFKDTHLQVVDK